MENQKDSNNNDIEERLNRIKNKLNKEQQKTMNNEEIEN